MKLHQVTMVKIIMLCTTSYKIRSQLTNRKGKKNKKGLPNQHEIQR